MASPEEYMTVVAPQFVDDPRLPIALEMAARQVAPDHCYYAEVVALLAAHVLEVGDRGGVSGAVSSRSEGGLSVSFAAGGSGLLGSTSYGAEVERLNRLCYGLTARTAWLTEAGPIVSGI